MCSGAAANYAPVAIERTAGMISLVGAALFLEDPERRLTVDEIARPDAASRFRPAPFHSTDINFGYTHSAYWLALPLLPAADLRGSWLLEVGYPSLDRVEVYTPRAEGGFKRQVAGDLQPFAERPYPHRNLVFPVELTPGKQQTIYLRVTSEGNLTAPLVLWRAETLQEHDQKSYALLSLYYGMLLALGLYNLLLFFPTRDRVFLAYVAFVACMAVGQASMNGFGNQFMWPDWPAWGNVALPSGMSATGLFGALFTRLFLGTRHGFPKLDRTIVFFIAVFAFSALSPAFAPYQFAAIFTSSAGLLFSGVAVTVGVHCLSQGHPGARYFLIAWSLLLLGVAVLAMRNMGWLPTNTLTLHSMQIGSALEMLLLSFALADRISVMRREKELANQEALAAKQTAVDALRRSEQELEQRVADRTRDLEEANVLLRAKERELEHLAQHDPLTGLANRMLLSDRVEHAIVRAQRNKNGVGLLVIDLDGFKEINDAYGHAIGDQMLVAISNRLTECVRETDTVARMGGDEFIVVLEDLNDRDFAARVAEKLVATAHQPVHLAPGPLQVSVSIGMAYFPQDAKAAEQLVEAADTAMYAAKSGGRNRWEMARSCA